MAHVRQQIRERAATTLGSLTTTGSRVYQSRIYPLGSNNLPGLLIYTKSEDSQPETMGTTRTLLRNLSLVVEGYVKQVSNFDDKVDLICSEVETAMSGDITLNNLAKNSYLESTEINYNDEGDQPLGTCVLTYMVEYMTAEDDPDSAVQEKTMKAEKGKTILYSPIGKDPIVVSLDRAEFLKSIGWTEKDRSASVSKTKINKQKGK